MVISQSNMITSKFVAPNGGWGWVIVMAYALNNIITIPIMQNFGLIYKDDFEAKGISAVDATIIININSAFGMILGLMNGPLLRIYGYRKISIAGTLMYSCGVILTAFASNFYHFVITYGMMASLGMGLSMSSYSLALNTYFNERRGRALGVAMTITGIGPIVMPPITSSLLSAYGTQGTMLIFGALSLNSMISSLLLHPVAWHCKKEMSHNKCEDDNEIVALHVQEANESGPKDNHSIHSSDVHKRKRTITTSSIDHDVETASIYGYELPLPTNRQISMINDKSVDGINLGSSMKIFDDEQSEMGIEENERSLYMGDEDKNVMRNNNNHTHHIALKLASQKKRDDNSDRRISKKMPKVLQWLYRVALFFDLDLLRDPIYVNLMLGMSIAILAELNFSLLTPFILSDMFLSTSEIAVVMSTIAIGDLIFRGISPFVGEWLKQSPKIMYLCSLIFLVISRSSLIFAETFTATIIVAVALGIAKGFRSIYMTLVIPSYVSLEKLASASSIQMVVNGCLLLIAGPLIGLIRDSTGSYVLCIVFINSVTMLTVIMWTIEIILRRIHTRC